MFNLELPNSRSKKDLETLALTLGLPERYVTTLSAISVRKNLVPETIMNLYIHDENYRNTIILNEKLQENPSKFYQTNKQITSVDKKLITFGSLSLSYSFASLHRLLRDIIAGSESIKWFVDFMKETSDETYSLEDVAGEAMLFNESYLQSQVKQKTNALKQDLRGNKVPEEITNELMKKLKFDQRDAIRDSWGLSGITQESIIDSMYLFFGSKKGEDYIQKWKNEDNREKLLDEFEYLIYNNPYINPLLIDHSLKTYMSNKFVESADGYLQRRKHEDNRTNNIEIDFGLK